MLICSLIQNTNTDDVRLIFCISEKKKKKINQKEHELKSSARGESIKLVVVGRSSKQISAFSRVALQALALWKATNLSELSVIQGTLDLRDQSFFFFLLLVHTAAAFMYVVLPTVRIQLAQCNNALESNCVHFIISRVIIKC